VLVLGYLLLGLLDGIAHSTFYPGRVLPPTTAGAYVIGTALIFLWYRLDSDARSFRRTPILSVGVIGLAILAVPYYLYRTRGFLRGSAALLVFLCINVGYGAASLIGQNEPIVLRT